MCCFIFFQIAKLSEAAGTRKKSKQTNKASKLGTSDYSEGLTSESQLSQAEELPQISKPSRIRTEPKKKIYKDLNIQVATLHEVKNDRAAAAWDFKEKRLAKPHRENINTNFIHLEKLAVAGKL